MSPPLKARFFAIFALLSSACATSQPLPEPTARRSPASTHLRSGSAKAKPWGGYWWSMLRGELALGWEERQVWTEAQAREFDSCIASYSRECVRVIGTMAREEGRFLSPLMKYDYYNRLRVERLYGPDSGRMNEYSHAVKWELDHHYIGANENHPFWNERGFAGKCIGWALANFEHAEPTRTAVIDEVRFEPADIKGLLAAIYNGAQFFITGSSGTEFKAGLTGKTKTQARADVSPKDLILSLEKTIDRKQMIEADLDPGEGVWNYPIHAYELNWDGPVSGKITGRITLKYANDEVGIEDVFSTSRARKDLISRELSFSMKVPKEFDGDFKQASAGEWLGDAIDRHPDALLWGIEPGWMDKTYAYKGTAMKTALNFWLLKRVQRDKKWVRITDGLLAEYYAPASR